MSVCGKLPPRGCEGHIFETPLADFRDVNGDKTPAAVSEFALFVSEYI